MRPGEYLAAFMGGRTNLDLDRPHSIGEMLTTAFALYWRVPILFLAFAAVVVVPYELIVLGVTGAGPFAQGQLGFLPARGLAVADSFLVTPLISALHVYAVRELGDGGRPTLAGTFRQSLPRLPVVAIAAGISGILISLGSLAFVIPGFLLLLIWPVVAQAAALEAGGPIDALRRSFDLTRGHRWHGFGLVFCAGLIAGVPLLALVLPFRNTATTAGTFIAGTAAQIVVRSFEALATGLLYFDLVARSQGVPVGPPPVAAGAAATANGNPLDPNNWSDEDRPAGWYVDPSAPWVMRYWAADGTPSWSERSAKTPKEIAVEWKAFKRKAAEAD
jgi:hypothetical protein